MKVASDPPAAFYWEDTADRAEMCGPGLRVAFARTGAIWTHRILLPTDGAIEIARTVETDPERDHPGRVVSPVYQEIQRHESALDSGLCLLLTGTLYKHHFSAVIRLGVDHDQPDGVMLDIDVADRCRSHVENLAATYTLMLDSGKIAGAGPEAITWDEVGPDGVRLELVAAAPSTLVFAEAGRSATRVQVLAALEPGTFTHRLHYRWRWTSTSGLSR